RHGHHTSNQVRQKFEPQPSVSHKNNRTPATRSTVELAGASVLQRYRSEQVSQQLSRSGSAVGLDTPVVDPRVNLGGDSFGERVRGDVRIVEPSTGTVAAQPVRDVIVL